MRKILPLLLAVAGVLAAALPAQAGTLQWKDEAKDSAFFVEPGNPVPPFAIPVGDEPGLDITKVSVETKGTNIVWTADIAKIGAANPNSATGVKFIYEFTYATGTFSIAVIDDLGYGKATELRGGTLGSTNPTPCGRCIGVIDRKGSKVVVTTPIDSLSRAFRTAVPGIKAFAPGSKLEKLSFRSARTYGLGTPSQTDGVVRAAFHNTFTADKSAPAPNATFTV